VARMVTPGLEVVGDGDRVEADPFGEDGELE
jgi:hypothetical protein